MVPHAVAVTKTVEVALCFLSLVMPDTNPTSGFGSQIFVFLHEFYQFLIDRDDFFRKSAVGSRERLDCGLIGRGGGRKVGDGVHGLLLGILMEVLHGGVVGGIVSRALGSLLQSAEFLMHDSEICFEMRPGFVGWVALTPHFAVIGEHAGFEDKILGGRDHLLR